MSTGHIYAVNLEPPGGATKRSNDGSEGSLDYACKWKLYNYRGKLQSECSSRFSCVKDLIRHLKIEHVESLRLCATRNFRLNCNWEKCKEMLECKYDLYKHICREHLSSGLACKCHGCKERK